MATTAPESPSRSPQSAEDSIKASLKLLERLLDKPGDRMFDPGYFAAVGGQLRRLHARIRIHHAIGQLDVGTFTAEVPPELTDELHRLHAEHATIIGQLDRLIRSVDSMADQSLEDKEVFTLRGRELIALLRRHEAEEDRLFYLSIWRDTGGES